MSSVLLPSRRFSWRAPVAAAVAATFVLASCSSEAESTTRPDSSTSSASTASIPEGWSFVAGDDVASVADAGEQVLPAQADSDDDVATEVLDTSKTIAGGDDIIEIYQALGLSSDIYAAPQDSATDAGQNAEETFLFNASTGTEGVLSLGGTLFLGNSLRRHTDLAAELRGAGTPAVIVDNLQGAVTKIEKISTAVGLPDAGAELAQQVGDQYAEAEALAAASDQRPRVIHVSATGAGGAPAVAGLGTAATNVIELAGAVNVGSEVGVENYSELSPEGVMTTDPDVILITENDLAIFGGAEGLWAKYPTLAQTPAGMAERVFVMPDLQLKGGAVASGTGAVALATALADLEL